MEPQVSQSDQEAASPSNKDAPLASAGPTGIGGWLILPAIWLTGFPLLAGLICLDAAPECLGFVAIQAVAAVAFWQKWRKARILILLSHVLALTFLGYLFRAFGGTFEAMVHDRFMIGCFIWTVLWVIYFMRSKRVRNTFGPKP